MWWSMGRDLAALGLWVIGAGWLVRRTVTWGLRRAVGPRCRRCGRHVDGLTTFGICRACFVAIMEGPSDPAPTPKAARDAEVRQAAHGV